MLMLKSMVSSKSKQESLSPRGILAKRSGGRKARGPWPCSDPVSSEGPGSILGAKEDTARNVHLSQGHVGFRRGKDT